MNILPCHTMRRAEEDLFASGAMSSEALMQAAVEAAAQLLRRDADFYLAARRFAQVVVYAGKGKNAGDAIGIARRLGFERVILRCAVPPQQMAQETRRMLAELPQESLSIADHTPCLSAGGALLIDGLLGSGARGPLRPEYAALVQEMNTLRRTNPCCATLAVDIPTGLNADTGLPHTPTVQADATLAIGCVKPGMLADGAEDYVGRLLCVPLPQVALPESRARVLDDTTLAYLPRRAYSCFKNRAGRVRIIAGSPGYIGAAQMCAEAALYAGAGLVELYCHHEVYPALSTRLAPEVMVRPVQHYGKVPAEGANALLIGPGLGSAARLAPADTAALRLLVEQPPCPLVLDADGLNLAAAQAWRISRRCILTPHPGEMRRLYPAAAELPRATCAARYVAEHPCTLLLKGARSIITDGAATYYNSTGGPHMAGGGQGDVLAGAIAAFAAQGLTPLQAAALGAYACGRAADWARAAGGYPQNVCASSLFRWLTTTNPSGLLAGPALPPAP